MLTGDVLGERARLTPERTALVCVATGERLSYAALDAHALGAARLMREALRCPRGARVGLLCGNRREFLEVFFGAPKAGVVVVPLSTRLTAHELTGIARDAELSALFYGHEHVDAALALEAALPGLRGVAFDAPARRQDMHYGAAAHALGPSSWRGEPGDPEDLYALLYTSGTTGKPKGVMVPQRMVAWNGYNTVACWGLRDDDVSPIFTPLYHAGALGAFLVPILTVGGTVVLHAGFDAGEVWRTIERERCTVALGVPTIYRLLMEAPEFAAADLSSVRFLISGGAPLPLFIIEAYQRRGVVFKQGYGLTEVGVNCFAMTAEDSRRKPGSIGRPLMQTQARLLDESGAEVAVDEVGELCLRGPHVCRGYWRNDEATAAAIDAQGFFHTGDLARRDAEGFFSIAGRRKDMFISGGVNVYPTEIEAELLQHPGVRDAAVVGVPDAKWGEAAVGFVVAAGEPPEHASLDAFLSSRLAKYKLPRAYVFVDALPRTPYGKVVKDELRALYLERGAP